MRPMFHALLMAFVLLSPMGAAEQLPPIVIGAEPNNGGAEYEFAGTHARLEGLLDALGLKVTADEIGRPVYVLAHENVRIGDILNLRGGLQKFGFWRIRFFFYSSDGGRMAELAFPRKAIPFMKNPEHISEHLRLQAIE